MPTNFDNAVEKLLEACLTHGDWAAVDRAAVVRDLRGRLRLVVKPAANAHPPNVGPALVAALGPWFSGPVLATTATSLDERRLAGEILGRATTWPPEWPTAWSDLAGSTHTIDPARWGGVQRVLSKQSWFGAPTTEARWDLAAGAPPVVAFYSFKGGVGRTTVLALVAAAMARAGKKVVCVDLDLEAPGLGDFLGAATSPSLLDALLTHAATGTLPAEDLAQTVSVHGASLQVVAAGALDRSYLEKLARLDYIGSASEADSPVAKALRAVLLRLRAHRPDVILLDCRAGLHDLGGLSLTDLAHVDVLVGRDTPQNHAGIRLTLEVIARRRPPRERRLLVVQSFVPFPLNGEPAAFTINRMRRRTWEACGATVYAELDDEPAEDASDAAHAPLPFAERNDVAAAQHLADIEADAIGTGGIAEIVTRLEALLAPEGA